MGRRSPWILLAASLCVTPWAALADDEGTRPEDEGRRLVEAAAQALDAYQQAHGTFTGKLGELGFDQPRGNRYTVYFAPAGPAELRTAKRVQRELDAAILSVDLAAFPNARFLRAAAATKCPITGADAKPGKVGPVRLADGAGLLVLAAGDLDGDPELDCWTIASFGRTNHDGTAVAAWTPLHERADVAEAAPAPVAALDEAQARELAASLEAPVHAAAKATCEGIEKGHEVPARLDDLFDAKTLPRDPWGNGFELAFIGERLDLLHFLAVTRGPNGALGDADDAAYTFSCAGEDADPRPVPPRTRWYQVEADTLVVAPGALPLPWPRTARPLPKTPPPRRSPGDRKVPWVELPGGAFTLGFVPAGPQATRGEDPRRPATVAPFQLMKTEASVELYARCVKAKGCTKPATIDEDCNWGVRGREQHPINCVSRAQAAALCAWLGGRLPTPEEWEWAAKDGLERAYPWGNELPASHVRQEGEARTRPVELDPEGATTAGLVNLAANVAEFTSRVLTDGQYEVRGASTWDDPARRVSSSRAYAGFGAPPGSEAATGLGVRCAADVAKPGKGR